MSFIQGHSHQSGGYDQPQPAGVYPPPPNIEPSYGYQGYFSEDYPPQPMMPPQGPLPPPQSQVYYHDHDRYGAFGGADFCSSMLRGCLATLCCCCLLENCCFGY